MILYPGVGARNPPGICDGIPVILYCDNSSETDPADPVSAKKGEDIGKISSLPFPLVKVTVWDPTYGVEVTYSTDGVFSAVR